MKEHSPEKEALEEVKQSMQENLCYSVELFISCPRSPNHWRVKVWFLEQSAGHDVFWE